MGQASASAAASSAIDNAGAGGLTINKPNWALWIVIGLGLVLTAIVLNKRKS
jgi:hypothetical protein